MNAELELSAKSKITKLTVYEKQCVLKAAERFFAECLAGDQVISKLYVIEVALRALQLQNWKKKYEPKDVFDIIHKHYGASLFSQYVDNPNLRRFPSPIELDKPVMPGLNPAAHYFVLSLKLWKYGIKRFLLTPMALDVNSNTALMTAIKSKSLEVAIAIISNITDPALRLGLLCHKNNKGDNALSMAIKALYGQEDQDYADLVMFILAFLPSQERDRQFAAYVQEHH